jgi:hypothetical protein
MKLEFSRIVRLFLLSLEKFGVIEKVFKITYKGKGVSLNDYYSSYHWNVRASIKNKYKKIFDPLIRKEFGSEKVNQYSIVIFYNNDYDVDNVTGIVKIFIDQLRACGVTENDTKKYFKSMTISVDPKLEKHTFEFLVCKLL